MNGGGEHVAAESGVPVAAEKVVQSVKEIVDCTEHEIYAVLEECDMDVNRAVEKLLSQGFTLRYCVLLLAFVVAVERLVFFLFLVVLLHEKLMKMRKCLLPFIFLSLCYDSVEIDVSIRYFRD
ncbi:GBF-interacting protein 1 [Vigna unguiculata]|uniref:GBF-interacting protein 1 n=1 Tax=Vigna unguiculata TaxID=3917 RepID=A0A4D6KNC8_VIGUN|nr:GBF-interacting protein 1 [Vigna unguiculata]